MDITPLSYAAPLLSLALLWTVAVITPGPNFFNIAQLAASQSKRHGVVAALGVATGTVLWGLAGGLGIKSLFSAAPTLYLAFKVAGGCYLIYLGLKQFKRKPAVAQSDSDSMVGAGRTLTSAYGQGFLGNMTNPKSALFVATIFATAMPATVPPSLLALAVLTMATLSFSWYCSVALLFSSRRVTGVYNRSRKWLDRFAGSCYLLFGAHLVANR
ncbi:LysE family transporter [Pseudomonas sp. SWRI74]|jgi:threonine/homoserine/homoserine lactone efflux protein|uniref:Threonine efflux protein n=2 Tax=Pseudomonas TaxID=286 RepID=A0A5E7EV26_PSEFL|nr:MULTISPECIES: LysE family transporter [Pseudomonas]MBV4524277.1 LysE family transporter [Pseudomonas azerbaijanoccidentalis]VVO30352.1 Threonine efflux protein [Pseudomonas fluorescens]